MIEWDQQAAMKRLKLACCGVGGGGDVTVVRFDVMATALPAAKEE